MHYLEPKPRKAHVLIVYRNFKMQAAAKPHHPHASHVGLGVNALQTAKVLRSAKIRTDVVAIWDSNDLRKTLNQPAHKTVSHCLIEAPFIPEPNLTALLRDFPTVHFICRCHSNVGFLQVEAGAIQLIRAYLILQEMELNFDFSGNSMRLCDFIEQAYSARVAYLPNLYDLKQKHHRQGGFKNNHVVKISSFGSTRLMKNHSSAAAAALMLAHNEGLNLEFFINVNREEHGKGVIQSLRNMFVGLKWAKMIEIPWESWAEFRRTVGHMDLAFQLSMSETFNLVSADAVAEGVPVAGSEAIEWLPADSLCHIDDVDEAATTGSRLLHDPRAAEKQMRALVCYQRESLKAWLCYLSNKGKQLSIEEEEEDEL